MHELLGLLDNILGPHQKHAHGEFYWMCPICHHHNPKLAINISKGAWHCWVCNASGRHIRTLFKKINASQQDMTELARILKEAAPYEILETKSEVLALPKEYHPLWQPIKRMDYRHALQYVTSRDITASDILRYQIGYCSDGPYGGRIIIPSFDANGYLNYFVGRSFYESDKMKYKNPKVSKNVVVFEQHINWKYPVILCEGVYDAIAIKRNAIPLLGKTLPSKLLDKLVSEQVNSVYLSLDANELKQTAQIASILQKHIKNVYMVSLDGKDPSEIGFRGMNNLIRAATPIGFAELVKLRVISS